jgi:hypothetical protein
MMLLRFIPAAAVDARHARTSKVYFSADAQLATSVSGPLRKQTGLVLDVAGVLARLGRQ